MAENPETVTFGLDGVTYEIDLSAKNAAKLRKTLEGYVEHGTDGPASGISTWSDERPRPE